MFIIEGWENFITPFLSVFIPSNLSDMRFFQSLRYWDPRILGEINVEVVE
jgi:hypothetical protein